MSKMSGKQKVVSDFDLNAFVEGADIDASPQKTKTSRYPARRNIPKPNNMKVTEVVQMKITKSEMETLKNKAGLVPISKWLRHHLKGEGVI